MLNLGLIHESIAREIPEREALVFRDRRLSWRELTDRTRRLSAVLTRRGLGCHRERSELEALAVGEVRAAGRIKQVCVQIDDAPRFLLFDRYVGD